ncbi:hypothetical protein [Rubrivivax rivuli]|uniref:Uncharacterized protein n=1 Tax=Rubrivivax rivuli TaxID=1862385 RepID=A0A437RH82_9BURK|nr:hypothetical protein [Rubrivivax rivuli]RVU46099.1 hypothetical protein EOE66_09535 [Rubrivivax rivuli]
MFETTPTAAQSAPAAAVASEQRPTQHQTAHHGAEPAFKGSAEHPNQLRPKPWAINADAEAYVALVIIRGSGEVTISANVPDGSVRMRMP